MSRRHFVTDGVRGKPFLRILVGVSVPMKIRHRKKRIAVRDPFSNLFGVTSQDRTKVRNFLQRMLDQLPQAGTLCKEAA